MNLVDTFEEHRSLLFATAYRMLGDATEAEDIVQEAYLRFQATTREIRSPRAYLCTIVTHLCLDALHSARITREQYLGPWLPQPIPGESDDMPIQAALEHESISLAWLILLQRLTPQERAVFVLHEVFEYPHAEIAAMIGLTAPNCRQLFHRAQQHLAIARALLPATGNPPADREPVSRSGSSRQPIGADRAAGRRPQRRAGRPRRSQHSPAAGADTAKHGAIRA
jgi:RNA polymerase sigma-70 factor (ECF subfamily)